MGAVEDGLMYLKIYNMSILVYLGLIVCSLV